MRGTGRRKQTCRVIPLRCATGEAAVEQQGAPQRDVWRRNHLPYGDGEMEVGGGLGSSSVLPSLAGPLTRGVAVQSGRYSKWVKKEVKWEVGVGETRGMLGHRYTWWRSC
eukprot:EG_transcript_26036